jgi:hypothetical protein
MRRLFLRLNLFVIGALICVVRGCGLLQWLKDSPMPEYGVIVPLYGVPMP